ncbi:hypothetical protein TNCV_5104921 [Trichonephila clavipes]|nr:hypothetical protein TNCV_5104921 [Trichonephila clavipes]
MVDGSNMARRRGYRNGDVLQYGFGGNVLKISDRPCCDWSMALPRPNTINNHSTHLVEMRPWVEPVCEIVESYTFISKLQDDINNFIFHFDDTPPRWSVNVRDYFDEYQPVPYQWIGQTKDYNIRLTQWPSRSPDLPLSNFFK